MKNILIFLLILLTNCEKRIEPDRLSVEPQTIDLKSCRLNPTLVDKCFWLHGRLGLYNGTPSIRLWKVGSTRILGISGSFLTEGYSGIPKEIENLLNWETEVWGQFQVCPFTKDELGKMQMICIETGEKLHTRHAN